MTTERPVTTDEAISGGPSAAADAVPRPLAGFEDYVRAATSGIKEGKTAAQVRAGLLAAGVDPLTAETAYRVARRRLFDSNRRLGAKLALYATGLICGGTLLFVPLGWSVPLVIALVAGLMLMGVATLVWLTGLGADEV